MHLIKLPDTFATLRAIREEDGEYYVDQWLKVAPGDELKIEGFNLFGHRPYAHIVLNFPPPNQNEHRPWTSDGEVYAFRWN